MKADFKVEAGIQLIRDQQTVDLHNFYEFEDLTYNVKNRSDNLEWRRTQRQGIPEGMPPSVSIKFCEVSLFEFKPRDANQLFTEAD